MHAKELGYARETPYARKRALYAEKTGQKVKDQLC